ncbi:MAG: TolC family protein, partial [Acidobacteriota bacterium]
MTSFFDRLRIAGDSRLLGGALRSVAAVALCGLGSVAIAADTIDLPINANGSESEPFESDAENGLDLTLTGVVEKALQHNVSLVVQRFNRSRTQLGVQEALSIYDFNLEADASTSSSTSPRSSLLQLGGDVITSDEDQWNFSLTRLTPWGGTARVFFNNTRRASSDVNQQPNPQFILNLSAGISQPLLRGRGREVTERNILVARNDTEINREQFRTEVENVVVNVTDVYWSLVGAKEQLKVAEESLKLAKELHEMNRIQVDVGTKAPLEMVQSEAGVARREEDIIRRRQAVEDAEDQLRRQINFARGRLWELPIIPVTEPEIAHSPIDVPAAVDQAYKMRPDVNRLRLTNEVRELDARVAKNNLMPR